MASEYDAWEHICGDAFDSKKRGIIAVLTVYFDASRVRTDNGTNAPTLHGLGAYIATQDHWRKFRKEWRGELAKKGLDHFHMTEFNYARTRAEHGKSIPERNSFYGWSVKELDAFLARLHRTINRKDALGNYRLESCTSTVIDQEFDDVLPREIRNNVQCSSPYIFNVVQVLKWIAHVSEIAKTDSDPIHYIFAGGDGEGGRLEKLFKEMWEDPVAYKTFRLSKSYSALPYDIADANAEPALQAADVAAFEMNKAVLVWRENNFAHRPLTEFRSSLTSLGRTKHYFLIYTKELLKKSFQEILNHQINRALVPEAFRRNTDQRRK